MTKRIDSDALGILNRALGLTGAGSQVTELTDGVVDQFIEIGQLARRGRTQADVQGIYTPTLRNEHTDAESISNSIDPYNVGGTVVVAPYPDPVPAQFDIWLLGASTRNVSGAAAGISNATLSIQVGTKSQGWGRVDDGTQVLVAQPIRLAYWNGWPTDGSTFGLRGTNRGPHQRIGVRLPRGGGGTAILFRTVSTLTTTVDCQIILGVFPVALGQDIVV